MARPTRIAADSRLPTILRIARSDLVALKTLVFRRYPDYEWATFAHFGWHAGESELVLTFAAIKPPSPGELDEHVGHVSFQEPYTLRIALETEKQPLAVGVIHSHPQDCAPRPSPLDDDMDGYYSTYFSSFAPDRPYVSLIVSDMNGEIAISGRAFWRGQWRSITHVAAERSALHAWINGERPQTVARSADDRQERLVGAFGKDAANQLRDSTVAVIGAGGTGSAAIEVLARAGVGHLIIVDPDHLETSNLERVHGSQPDDAARRIHKAALAKRHVNAIDPSCRVDAYVGALPQSRVLEAVIAADVAIGCTDQQHSRLALSDVARRYLVPAIDCGVALEGANARVTGQIIQCVRFLPDDPCAICRKMIVPERLSQELMAPDGIAARRVAAERARRAGERPGAYWQNQPQLNTVGYLTTIAGSLAAGYAIGWITGRFEPPFGRMQMNLAAPFFDVTDSSCEPDPECACGRARGRADQGVADALISAPAHWTLPLIV